MDQRPAFQRSREPLVSDRTPTGWRVFFWVAAAYNIVVGLGAFHVAEWGSSEALGAVLIVCFGIVYAFVARQPKRFAPVLIAGIVGKGMVVAMLGPENWGPGGDRATGAIVAGDLVFALGFAAFLIRNRA